jgi:hypothetical protein
VLRIDRRERNHAALTNLWTVGAVWVALAVLTFLEGVFEVEPPEVVGWSLLVIGTGGFVLALAGVTSIRTHGESVVAIIALVLALSLPMASTYLEYGLFGGFGLD